MINEFDVHSSFGLENTTANENDLISGQLPLLVITTGKGVERRQEANPLEALDRTERVQNVENLVHFGRRKRLNTNILELSEIVAVFIVISSSRGRGSPTS